MKTLREKLLGLLLLTVCSLAWQIGTGAQSYHSQTAPITAISAPGAFSQSITTAGIIAGTNTVGATINLIGTGVEYHKLFAYSNSNSLLTCTYQLEGAATSAFATTSLIGSVMSCNTQGASGVQSIPTAFPTAAQGKFNYVRVHFLTATAGATSTLSILYRGYNQDPDFNQAAISTAAISVSTTATSVLVSAGTGGIQVTYMAFSVGTTTATAQTVTFVRGASSCTTASGNTIISGALTGATQAGIITLNPPTLYQLGDGTGTIMKTNGSEALCVLLTGTQPVSGFMTFRQAN